jgi:hypothetical protein
MPDASLHSGAMGVQGLSRETCGNLRGDQTSKSALHGRGVLILLNHLGLESLGEEARDAGVAPSGFDANPASEVVIESNGNVAKAGSHDTEIL